MRKISSQGTAKKALALLTAAVLMGTGVGILPAPQAEAAAAKAKKLTVKAGSKTLYVGKYSPYKTTKLKVKVTPKKAKQKVKFKSLSKKVATVSSKGKVTAKKKGTAKIKVTTVAKNKKGKKLSKTIKIKVKKYVAPTGIKASINASTLQVGKTAQITASLSGKPTCKTIVYTSSDSKVATVSSKGLVKAVAAGKATITAKSKVKGSKGKVLQKSFAITVTGGSQGGSTTKPTPKPTPAPSTEISAKTEITPVKVDNLPALEEATADIVPGSTALNTKNDLSMADSDGGMTIAMTMTINKLNASGNTFLWNTSGSTYPMMFQAVTSSGELYTELDWRCKFTTGENFLPIGEEFSLVTTYTNTEIRIYVNGELKAYYNAETGVSVGGTFAPSANPALFPTKTTAYLDTVRSSWTQFFLGVAPTCIDQGKTVTDCTVKSFGIYKKALQPAPKDNKEKLIYPETATYEISPDQDTVTFGGAILLNSTSNAKMTYTSSDSDIAGFTKDGKLRMLKAGQVTITAKTATGVTAACKATINYSTIAIHDPSVFQDPVSGYYYTVGSHCLAGYSKDMKSWAWVANSNVGYNDGNKLFTKPYLQEFAEVYQYVPSVDNKGNRNEGIWAPSIIYSKTAKKYFMYVTIADGTAQGKCVIALTSSDKPDGPYKYEKMIVASAMTTDDVDKTNLMAVLGITDKSQVPAKYTSNDRTYPDCIDATVFYDHTGKLWMTYGSFTCAGGIRLIQLDPKTGDRLKSATYEDNGTASVIGDKDPYYGLRLANNNGEGPFIMEVPSAKSSTGYYYFLWTSVGGLQSYGGYNMRMYRSENVEGPYEDTAGNKATSELGRPDLGLRVMDNYKFSFMDFAYTSCGGNSALLASKAGTAENGKMFLHYHQKWANGTEAFVTKSNQMFLNEDGWLVTAPFAYDGESMNKTYTKEEVAGEYEFILHRTSYIKTQLPAYDYSDSVVVKLNADGTVSGGKTGTWTFDKNYITIKIGDETFKGVVFEQTMEDKNLSKAMVFTAVGDGNIQSVWGVKALMGDDHYADLDQKKINVPTGESVTDTFTLPTTSARYGFAIAWSADKDTVTFDGGNVSVQKTDAEQDVVITGTFSKGDYSKQYKWNMKVLSNKAYADIDKEKIEIPEGTLENNFTLPTTSDKYGFAIAWSADKEAISFAGGAATVTNGDTEQEVTITGTFTKGSYSTSYTWKVTVAAFRVPLNTIVLDDSITLPTEYKGKTVTWESSDSSVINASTGAVTRQAETDQTVTLTATVEGRKITYEMTVKRKNPVFSQDYENVDAIDNVFASASLGGGRSIETADGNKFLQFKQDGSSGNRGGMASFGTPLVNTGSDYVVELDLAVTSGNVANRSQSQVVLTSTGTDGSSDNNYGVSKGYILKLSTGPSSTEWTLNDSKEKVVLTADTWVHIKAYVYKNGKVNLIITNKQSGNELYNGTVEANGDGSLTGLYIQSGRGNGLTKIDNISVY